MDKKTKSRFQPHNIVTLSPTELQDNGFDLTGISEEQYMRLADKMRRYYEENYSDVLRQVAREVGLQPLAH